MNAAEPESTIFIVDDDEETRLSLEYLVKSIGLHAELFGCAEAFLDSLYLEHPGCLVTDIRMPGMGGLRLLERMFSQGTHLPIIICTGHANVTVAVESFHGGAFYLLEKPLAHQKFLHCIQDALTLSHGLLAKKIQKEATATRLSLLTPREYQVLERLVLGKANKCIAGDLGISERTVEKHRAKIMEKMGAHSLAELITIILLYRQYG